MHKVFGLRKVSTLHSQLCRSIISIRNIILGIETSCDDTGCAIVSPNGKILGESLYSQHQIHLE